MLKDIFMPRFWLSGFHKTLLRDVLRLTLLACCPGVNVLTAFGKHSINALMTVTKLIATTLSSAESSVIERISEATAKKKKRTVAYKHFSVYGRAGWRRAFQRR